MECGFVKSKLKRSLQIEVTRRNAGDADATVIDGSAFYGLYIGQQMVLLQISSLMSRNG